jgi:hypothetical protein
MIFATLSNLATFAIAGLQVVIMGGAAQQSSGCDAAVGDWYRSPLMKKS